MLREAKELHGAMIHAIDGEIGRVDEILFDDANWTVRYLVVNTGSWLFGRKVLISPMSFGHLDWDSNALHLNLTRKQIENSPGVAADEPVSRQWETDYFDYYQWPYYWSGAGAWGDCGYQGALFAPPISETQTPLQSADEQAVDHADAHLRSAKEVTGYGIYAADGHIGHVEDFIFNDSTWRIGYFAVDTRDWWPGKRVLLPPDWISEVNWPDKRVTVNVTRDQVRSGPEWTPGQPVSPAFEDQLYGYYNQQRPALRALAAV